MWLTHSQSHYDYRDKSQTTLHGSTQGDGSSILRAAWILGLVDREIIIFSFDSIVTRSGVIVVSCVALTFIVDILSCQVDTVYHRCWHSRASIKSDSPNHKAAGHIRLVTGIFSLLCNSISVVHTKLQLVWNYLPRNVGHNYAQVYWETFVTLLWNVSVTGEYSGIFIVGQHIMYSSSSYLHLTNFYV